MSAFTVVRCPSPKCGSIILDCVGLMGIVRVKCRRCKHRVWVGGDGQEAVIVQYDRPE